VRLFDPDDSAPSGASAEPDRPAPEGQLRRIMLLVAYDGALFHGFALQPGQPTVAGRLAEALGRLAGHPVALTCAGRTDSGVHAAGQVVHADVAEAFVDAHFDRERLIASLSHQVGPEIAVLDVKRAVEGFDARRSATSRRYRYLLLCSPGPDPLLRHMTWHVPAPLDVAAMRLAADTFLGEHDFSAFCRRPPDGGSTVRRVMQAAIVPDPAGDLLRFEIEASSFCHQMVRSIVGAIVSVGEGRLTAAGVFEMLQAGDRSRGSRLAPPGGLCLESVRYPAHLVPGGTWLPPVRELQADGAIGSRTARPPAREKNRAAGRM
jgi:tRNA pseudouridine38-40 synthase